ncbi:MAG: cysteine synthase family protein [Anaerolineales bacterium]|nr:cysteine synthase family protein [Anaerolineales bacterium]
MRNTDEMTIVRTIDRIKQSSLIDQVGNTPLIPLRDVRGELAKSVEIYVKAEWHNPGGSVKDRPAAAIIQNALDGGLLGDSIHLLDSTSGNMGISYATLAATFGIKVHLTIPANASKARLSTLRALGAELTLTDPLEGSDGARIVATEIANQSPERYFFADQYSNPMNWKSHYLTTGPEILQQTEGRLTHFIAGLGTSGTMMGTGKYLKANADDVTLMAVQPDGPLHGLEGLKHMASSPNPEFYDPGLPDAHLQMSTEDAYRMAKRLAKEEGLLVGISAAAAVSAAFQIGAELEYGLIVVVLPDSASKYLDLDFWRDGQ